MQGATVINDETEKYRELMAYGLLASAALGVIAALSLLFKSSDDLGSNVGFPEKAALYGPHFTSGLVILALVGAVFLVTRFGELTANARIVVLAAMGIGAVDLLFAVITFLAQFGADSGFVNFGGAAGAGKVVGAIVGLAELTFLVVALLFIFTTFQSLPAPVAAPAPQWGQGQGFGQYGGQQQAAPGQQPWRQPEQGQAQQGWSQQGWAQQGQGQQGQGQQGQGQQGWAQPGTSSGWGSPGDGQQAWSQPQSQPQSQSPSPTSTPPAAAPPAWPQPDSSGWGQQQSSTPPAPQTTPVAPVEPVAPVAADEPDEPVAPVELVAPVAALELDEPDEPDAPDAPDAPDEPDKPSADDKPDSDQESPPPAQGWWQHPGQ